MLEKSLTNIRNVVLMLRKFLYTALFYHKMVAKNRIETGLN